VSATSSRSRSMATAGGFTRGEFESAEVAQDIADREDQLRSSVDKTMNRLHRVGGFKGADVDENTLVQSEDKDLEATRAAMKEYNDQVQADSEMKQMSPELQSLMRHMHSYATRYNVDLYRSLKENGGRQSQDGQGAMSKTKFTSVLLSAFNRMGPMFKPTLLTEICTLYGTGPMETLSVADKKNKADAYAGRLDHPSTVKKAADEIHMEVKWVGFCNDVGEGYMTFPPRGHGVELQKAKVVSEMGEEGEFYAT